MLNHKIESSISIVRWVINADRNDIVQMLLALATRLEGSSPLITRLEDELVSEMRLMEEIRIVNSRVDKSNAQIQAQIQEVKDSISILKTDVRSVVSRNEDLENDLSFYCPPD